MKRSVTLILLVLLTSLVVVAGEPMVGTKVGLTLRYMCRNTDNEITGYVVSRIKSVDTLANGRIRIVEVSSRFDANNQPLMIDTMRLADMSTVYIIDGNKQYVNRSETVKSIVKPIAEGIKQQNDKVKLNVTTTGPDAEYPLSFRPDTSLPDYSNDVSINMSANDQSHSVKISITCKKRKVERRESIVVKAGTFDCWRITESTSVKFGILGDTSTEVSWYCPSLGVVRSQTVGNRGKVLESQVLVSVSGR